MSSSTPESDAQQAAEARGCPTELFRRFAPRLLRVLSRYRISEPDAEDILQEVFLLYLLRGRSIHSPEAWLVGAVRNRCLMLWRQRKTREAHLESLETEEPRSFSLEGLLIDRDLLSRALSRLSVRDRQVLILRIVLECTGSEIDRLLGTSPGTASKLVQRARERLRRVLDDPDHEPQNARQRHPREARLSLH